MKVFHSPGRIGDCIYALWTMKALGGGRLIVSDYHQGNWSLDIARTMESFLRYQTYVEDVEFVTYPCLGVVDYDLHDAERDYNPEAFPEWDRQPWPSNCHLAKRYAVHFGLTFDGKPWLTAPFGYQAKPIAFHAPEYRIIRSVDDWLTILAALDNVGLPAAFLGRNTELLDSAMQINSAKVFLGAVSSCHAIAEGLGKIRLVEQAPGCFNVNPTACLNGVSNDDVVARVKRYL